MSEQAERYAHFIAEGADAIDEGQREGTPVSAICGKLWVPSRDPNRMDLCPACVDLIRRGWAA